MNFRNTSNKWGWMAIAFHWITAITVVSLFTLGLWMVELSYYDDWYKTGPFIHKSIGVTLFFITVARIVWRSINQLPEELETHRELEKKAARIAHITLYIVIFSVMFSGYLISTADGRSVEVFNLFHIPAIIHGIEKQEDIAGVIHFALAIALISIALLHALAAIKHHVIDKDRTLKRMLGL